MTMSPQVFLSIVVLFGFATIVSTQTTANPPQPETIAALIALLQPRGTLAPLPSGMRRTRCQELEGQAQLDAAIFIVGGYYPQCDENGNFKATQYHGGAGLTWCATPDGQEITERARTTVDCDAERLKFSARVLGQTNNKTVKFFVGNFFSNATIEPQVNVYNTYVALGNPADMMGQSMEVDIQPAGQDRFRIIESLVDTGKLIQDVYFQLDVENSTILPGNVPISYIASVTDDHTLHVDYVFGPKNAIIRILNVTFCYGKDYNDLFLADSPVTNGQRVTGSRHYVRRQ